MCGDNFPGVAVAVVELRASFESVLASRPTESIAVGPQRIDIADAAVPVIDKVVASDDAPFNNVRRPAGGNRSARSGRKPEPLPRFVAACAWDVIGQDGIQSSAPQSKAKLVQQGR